MQCGDMRAAARNDLFPSSDEVVSMSREFGVPLTADDIITGKRHQLIIPAPIQRPPVEYQHVQSKPVIVSPFLVFLFYPNVVEWFVGGSLTKGVIFPVQVVL